VWVVLSILSTNILYPFIVTVVDLYQNWICYKFFRISSFILWSNSIVVSAKEMTLIRFISDIVWIRACGSDFITLKEWGSGDDYVVLSFTDSSWQSLVIIRSYTQERENKLAQLLWLDLPDELGCLVPETVRLSISFTVWCRTGPRNNHTEQILFHSTPTHCSSDETLGVE
jgi:hypothetical protein